MAALDLKALQACTDRIRSQIDSLEGRDDDTGESNVGESDGDGEVERPSPQGKVSMPGLTKADVKRLGISKFLMPRREATTHTTFEDEDSDEDEDSSDGDFLQFRPSELRHVDESFSVGASRRHVLELLSKFRADERTFLAQDVCDWFNGAAANSCELEEELKIHEQKCLEEEMQVEEAHRELGTHIQARDVTTIQHMRTFYDKIQEFRPKKHQVPSSPSSAKRGESASPSKSERGESMQKTRSDIQIHEDPAAGTGGANASGSQVRASLPAATRPAPASDGSPRAQGSGQVQPAAAGQAAGGGGRQGASNSRRTRRSEDAEEDSPGEDETLDPQDLALRSGRRAGHYGTGALLRRVHTEDEMRSVSKSSQVSSRRRTPANYKNANQFLASDLLEVIAQQQDEIAHFKTRNDLSVKGAETMRTALEYLRNQANVQEEVSAASGGNQRFKREIIGNQLPEASKEVLIEIREKLKVKAIGDLIMSKEGREQLRAVEGANPNIAQHIRTAEMIVEVESLQTQVKDLEAELSQTMTPAERVEVLKQEIDAMQAEAQRQQPQTRPSGVSFDGHPPSEAAGSADGPPIAPPSIGPSPGPAGSSRSPSKISPADFSTASSGAIPVQHTWLVEASDDALKRIVSILSDVEKGSEDVKLQREKMVEALGAAKHRAALEEEEKIKGTVNFQDSPEDAALQEVKAQVKEAQQTLMEARAEGQNLQKEEEELRKELKSLRETKKQAAQAAVAASREEGRLLIAKKGKKGGTGGEAATADATEAPAEDEAANAAHEAPAQEEAAEKKELSHHDELMMRLRSEFDLLNEEVKTLEEQHAEVSARVERLRKARAENQENLQASVADKAGEAQSSVAPLGTGQSLELPVRSSSTRSPGMAASPEAGSAGASVVDGVLTPAAAGSPANHLVRSSPDGSAATQDSGNAMAPQLLIQTPKGTVTAQGGSRLRDFTFGSEEPAHEGGHGADAGTHEDGEQVAATSTLNSNSGHEGAKGGRGGRAGGGRLSTQSDGSRHRGSGSRHDSVASEANAEGGGVHRPHNHVETVVVDKREEQVQDLLMYQSEHTRLERQIADIEERIRQAKLKAQGKKGDGRDAHVTVKSLIVPEENRTMRREVTLRQRELNELRKRWWQEKNAGGPQDDPFAGHAQLAASMLLACPPEAPAAAATAAKEAPAAAKEESEGSYSSSSSSSSTDEATSGEDNKASRQASMRRESAFQRRGSVLGRAWLGLEAAGSPLDPNKPTIHRHSLAGSTSVPVAMMDWKRQRGSLPETRRRMSLSAAATPHLGGGAANAGQEKGGKAQPSPMEQFERILLTTGLSREGSSSSSGHHHSISAPSGQRRSSLVGNKIPGQLLRRRMSQPAFMHKPDGALGLVGTRHAGLPEQQDEEASNASSLDSSGSGSDAPRKEHSERRLSLKKPPLPRRNFNEEVRQSPRSLNDDAWQTPRLSPRQSPPQASPSAARSLQPSDLLQTTRLPVPSSSPSASKSPTLTRFSLPASLAASPSVGGSDQDDSAEAQEGSMKKRKSLLRMDSFPRRASWGGRLGDPFTAKPEEVIATLQVRSAGKSANPASSSVPGLASLLRSVPIDGSTQEEEHITVKELRSAMGGILEK